MNEIFISEVVEACNPGGHKLILNLHFKHMIPHTRHFHDSWSRILLKKDLTRIQMINCPQFLLLDVCLFQNLYVGQVRIIKNWFFWQIQVNIRIFIESSSFTRSCIIYKQTKFISDEKVRGGWI